MESDECSVSWLVTVTRVRASSLPVYWRCRIMTTSIKLFQSALKFHKTIGICPSRPNQSRINWRTAIFLLLNVQYTLTTAAFLIVGTKSMFDYGFAFFLFLSLTNGITIYLLFVWQLDNTLKFIANCERFIENREYHSEHTNENGSGMHNAVI